MLILGLDTSWTQGSIALAEGDGASFSALEVVPIAGGTFSAQLIPQIAALLSKHKRSKQDLDGFAAANGPGSFTGLRVGLAAVKALAEVLKKPIAAVSVLEALAAQDRLLMGGSGSGLRVVVALDATRGEVFLGDYEYEFRSIPMCHSESLVTLEDLTQKASRWGRGQSIETPDDSVIEYVRAHIADPFLFSVHKIDRPRSDAIARLGIMKILAGRTVAVEALDANYMRRSDAEIFARPKA